MRKILLCSALVAAMSPATVMAQVSETAADAKGSWNLFFVYTGAKRAAGADGSYDSLQACRIAAQAMLAECGNLLDGESELFSYIEVGRSGNRV